jgi:hypothetical protein
VPGRSQDTGDQAPPESAGDSPGAQLHTYWQMLAALLTKDEIALIGIQAS